MNKCECVCERETDRQRERWRERERWRKESSAYRRISSRQSRLTTGPEHILRIRSEKSKMTEVKIAYGRSTNTEQDGRVLY